MKFSRFLFFTAVLLCLAVTLRAAQAPQLETLLAEYHKARSDVLGKLNESYALQADELAKKLQAVTNLEGAENARTFAKQLREADQNVEIVDARVGGKQADPLNVLQSDYAQARADNLKNVYIFYATAAGNLRRELLKEKNTAGAEVVTAFLEKIKPAGATPKPTASPTKKKRAAGN
jgi:type IV pilus biogenesis protein CpaD/CtpE